MARKYLKIYEKFKSEYLKENLLDEIEAVVETEDEDIEDSEDEELETSEEVVDTEEVVETEDENTEDDTTDVVTGIDISPVAPSNGFSPSDNFSNQPKAEWCIIKCMSNNGERVGIAQETDNDCEVLCSGLHYDDAICKVEDFARKCCIPCFDNECDVFIGKVSKHFIKKPVKSSGGFDGSGSYKNM